jgi:hypothetical protein
MAGRAQAPPVRAVGIVPASSTALHRTRRFGRPSTAFIGEVALQPLSIRPHGHEAKGTAATHSEHMPTSPATIVAARSGRQQKEQAAPARNSK